MRTATENIPCRRFGLIAGLLVAASLAIGVSSALGAQQIKTFDTAVVDAAGDPVNGAGSHPQTASTDFLAELYAPSDSAGSVYAIERPKDAIVDLPPGFVGNPQATTNCSVAQFAGDVQGRSCPLESQVGFARLWLGVLGGSIPGLYITLFNLGPANGTPAVLGLNILGVAVFASASVRTGDDYGLTIASRNIPTATDLLGTTFGVWGNPQDPSHDTERGFAGVLSCSDPNTSCPPHPSTAPNIPFLSLPTSCGTPPATKLALSSWEHPGEFARASNLSHDNVLPIPQQLAVDSCDALDFPATLDARPTTNAGDSASGLDVDLHTPQNEDPNGTATPHLKDSVVTLPKGLVVNPSSANGLGTCSFAQIGYLGSSNEEQTVDLSGIGPFTLTFDGETTATIPGGSEANAVQAALEALPNLSPGDVSVTGSHGGPYSVEFTGNLAGQDVPPMSAEGLTNKIQKLNIDASSGSYKLTYGASTTSNRPVSGAIATTPGVAFALNTLPDVVSAGGSVTVTGGPPDAGATHPYYVEFDGGSFAGTDQSISATPVVLNGGAGTITVTDEQAAGEPISGTVVTSKEVGHLSFTPDAADCPDAARLGSLEVETPLLDHVIQGSIYLAKPFDNPFNKLIALYITANDTRTGIGIKLAGHVELDPKTGQVTAVFDNNPQLPFEHLRLHFFGGSTGALRTPSTCGAHTTSSTLTPWSAPDSGPPVQDEDTWQITQNCAGSEDGKPNSPSFDAGSVSPVANSFNPFVVHLRREDGSQNFKALDVSPPQGLIAKLAGVEQCSDADLAAAEQKSGAAESASPSCPASSHVGTVVAGAGAGPGPYYAHGEVYLTGPYKGAPISLATVIPAAAGPFDLGTVVTRVAAYIDPVTARINAVSDDIPSILDGIPLDVRTVDLTLDRDQFSKTGTSCDPSSVDGSLTSTLGQVASLTSRFQLAECSGLGFRPKIALRLKGGTKRGGHPQLTAVIVPRPGDANIAAASVAFPRSEFLENDHIRTICTRVQFASDSCPAAAIYGESTVYTPILDYPLSGHVYLRSSDNLLPDLVPDLRGPSWQPVKVEAVGRTDSIRGGIRSSFDFFPDAEFSKAVLKMQGGNKGLLVNSRNICGRTYRATAKFTAHNGDTITLHPKVKARCGRKTKTSHKRHRRATAAAVAQRSAIR